MFKHFLAYILLALACATMGAQEVRLPDRSASSEKYASLSKFDIKHHLPEFEYRTLGSFRDETNQQIAADLLDYASTFLGTRYRRGGKSPKGFDCSGFTGYVFREFGYPLAASSQAQYSNGVEVPAEEVQPGDLLFFKGRNSGSSRIGHVGIAIDCDPATGVITFIHASCSSGISIDRTSAPYYAKRFVGVRRVIGD